MEEKIKNEYEEENSVAIANDNDSQEEDMFNVVSNVLSDISDKQKEEYKKIREELDVGTSIIIDNVELGRIKNKDMSGNIIEPTTNSAQTAEWYSSKLEIYYHIKGEKDIGKRVEYVPSIKYFINNSVGGVKKLSNPVFPREKSKNALSHLRNMVLNLFNITSEDLSDLQFVNLLKQCNAKIGKYPPIGSDDENIPKSKGVYNGVSWFRNDFSSLTKK